MTATVTDIEVHRRAAERRLSILRTMADQGPMRVKRICEVTFLGVPYVSRFLMWARSVDLVDHHMICGLTARGIAVAVGIMPMPSAPKRHARTSEERPSEITAEEAKRIMDLYDADWTVHQIALAVKRSYPKVSAVIRAATGKDRLRWRGLSFKDAKVPGPDYARRSKRSTPRSGR